MPRISLQNIIFGFIVILISSCAGAFVGSSVMDAFFLGEEQRVLHSWGEILRKSAHGHTNLFAMIHILLGLTFPYSHLSQKIKFFQSLGWGLGTLSMAILLPMRSYIEPMGNPYLDGLNGIFLSIALASLASHVYGLLLKLRSL